CCLGRRKRDRPLFALSQWSIVEASRATGARMAEQQPPNRILRHILVGTALVAAAIPLLLGASYFTSPAVMRFSHFQMFWSAGRLNAGGGTPYWVEHLASVQQSAGWPADEPPFVMWGPPWTLTLVMPFGVLPFAVGRLLWLLLLFGLLLVSMDRLWRVYGGPGPSPPAGGGGGLSPFPPPPAPDGAPPPAPGPLRAVRVLARRNNGGRVWGGAAAAVLALKPHLLYLFWVVLPLWVLHGRRWRVVAGLGLAGLAAAAIPLLLNPLVYHQYFQEMPGYQPAVYLTPTLGTLLRLPLGGGFPWLQYVPALFGTVWVVCHWWKHRRTWDWVE